MANNDLKQSASQAVSGLWWLWVVQAIVAIAFGVLAVFWPGLTLTTLVYLLSVFVMLTGITEIVRAVMSVKTRSTWWMTLVIGLLTTGVGIYLARNPGVSFATFILIVSITFIIWGVIELIQSFLDVFSTSRRVLTFLTGLSGIFAGIITLFQPESSGLAFVWVLGLFALVNGITALVVAIEHHDEYSQLQSVLK